MTKCTFDWIAIEAIGTWIAAIGTVAAVVVALRLAQSDQKQRRESDVMKKWNRIYRHLRDMALHLSVAAEYDKLLRGSGLKGPDIGRWMEGSSASFKIAKECENEIIDELCGERLIPIEQKERIFKTIDMRTAHNKTFEQTYTHSKAIEDLNRELVLPRADPDLAKILKNEKK